jgi:hypothetical protein
MKHINPYSHIYTPIEIQLAHEIAERLNDPASLSQFLRYTKEVPHEVLRDFLNNASSVPDNKISVSRAAIFVSRVKNYKQFNNGYPGH